MYHSFCMWNLGERRLHSPGFKFKPRTTEPPDIFLHKLPVVLGEDIQWRSIIPAPSADHLQVHRGRSVNVASSAAVLFGFHSPQRLLLLGFLQTRRLSRLRVIVSGHCSEKLENSPGETKMTACDSRRTSRESSAFDKQECEGPELQMDRIHNKYETQYF